MTYAVALIMDDTFAEPHVVIGTSLDQLYTAVMLYLNTAQPATPSGRVSGLSKPTEGWGRYLLDVLDDIDDITVEFFTTEIGNLVPAGQFLEWTERNREALKAQHTPYVVDVVDQL